MTVNNEVAVEKLDTDLPSFGNDFGIVRRFKEEFEEGLSCSPSEEDYLVVLNELMNRSVEFENVELTDLFKYPDFVKTLRPVHPGDYEASVPEDFFTFLDNRYSRAADKQDFIDYEIEIDDFGMDVHFLRTMQSLNSGMTFDEIEEECSEILRELIDEDDADFCIRVFVPSWNVLKLFRFLRDKRSFFSSQSVYSILQLLNAQGFVAQSTSIGKKCSRCEDWLHNGCTCYIRAERILTKSVSFYHRFSSYEVDDEAEIILEAFLLKDDAKYWNDAVEFFASINNVNLEKVPNCLEWQNALNNGFFDPFLPHHLLIPLIVNSSN